MDTLFSRISILLNTLKVYFCRIYLIFIYKYILKRICVQLHVFFSNVSIIRNFGKCNVRRSTKNCLTVNGTHGQRIIMVCVYFLITRNNFFLTIFHVMCLVVYHKTLFINSIQNFITSII